MRPDAVCARPSCATKSKGVVCNPCKRELPSWLTTSRGRNRAEMAHDIRAFCGSKDPEDAPRGLQHAQGGIWYGRRASRPALVRTLGIVNSPLHKGRFPLGPPSQVRPGFASWTIGKMYGQCGPCANFMAPQSLT